MHVNKKNHVLYKGKYKIKNECRRGQKVVLGGAAVEIIFGPIDRQSRVDIRESP